MEEKCCFEMQSKCTILTGTKKCENCKFRKTEQQFRADHERAERILFMKGLIASFDGTTVGTKKINEK